MDSDQPPMYTHLAGGATFGAKLLGRGHSLWLARDHLLCVDDQAYSRHVVRIDFGDIEAVVVRPSAAFLWTNLVCAIPCVMGTVLVISGSPASVISGVLIMAPFLMALAVNLLRGKTCDCRIQTRVQTKRLPVLSRQSIAERILPVLDACVREAQSGLPDVASQVSRQLASAPAGVQTLPGLSVTSRAARHRLHCVLFLGFALHGIVLAVTPRFFSVLMLWILIATGVLLFGLAVVTAALQHRRVVALRLRVLTWLATAGVIIEGFAAYGFLWFAVVDRQLIDPGFSMANQLDQLTIRLVSTLVSEGLTGGMHAALAAAAIACGVVAVVGFAAYMSAPPRIHVEASGAGEEPGETVEEDLT